MIEFLALPEEFIVSGDTLTRVNLQQFDLYHPLAIYWM